MLKTLNCSASSKVEETKVSIFTASIDKIFLLPKTSNSCDVSLEISFIGTQLLIRPFEVVYFGAVIHTNDDLAFVLGDFDAIRGRAKLDSFKGVAATSRGVPEAHSIVIRSTC